jgi:hypothetical protein
MNIFQISQELLDIEQELEDNGGELTEELEAKLSVSQSDFKTKVKSYSDVIKSIKADIKLIDEETSRLKELKESKNKVIARLEKIIIWAVDMFGDSTKSGGKFIDFGTGKVSVRNTEKVEVDEEFAEDAVTRFMEEIRQVAFTKELNQNDIEDLMTIPDDVIDGINAEIKLTVPLKDFYGPAGNILRAIYDSNKTFKYSPAVSKTELKSALKENPEAYPMLAHIVENKTVTIK